MALSIPLPTQESDMLHLELVFINLQARDREEALSFLAQRMAALGVVSPDFPAAVLAREKAFPTGLQMPEAALALPHTETGRTGGIYRHGDRNATPACAPYLHASRPASGRPNPMALPPDDSLPDSRFSAAAAPIPRPGKFSGILARGFERGPPLKPIF